MRLSKICTSILIVFTLLTLVSEAWAQKQRPPRPRPTPKAEPAIQITEFGVEAAGGTIAAQATRPEGNVVLRFKTSGFPPSQYRLAECGQLPRAYTNLASKDAKLTTTIAPGTVDLCLQIQGSDKKQVYTSNIASMQLDVLRRNTATLILSRVILSTETQAGQADRALLGDTVRMSAVASGVATHFRAAECNSFSSAGWQSYGGSQSLPKFSFTGSGRHDVCLQLKNEPQGATAVVSAQKRASIEMVRLVQRDLVKDIKNELGTNITSSAVLETLIQHATKQGYGFGQRSVVQYGPECSCERNEKTVGLFGLLFRPDLPGPLGVPNNCSCFIDVFQGKPLNRFWSAREVQLREWGGNPPGCTTIETERPPSGNLLSATFRVSYAKSSKECPDRGLNSEQGEAYVFIGGVIVEGPEGVNWRDAFAR
jgi:hypothetical protein